jgi:hypothetical protein
MAVVIRKYEEKMLIEIMDKYYHTCNDNGLNNWTAEMDAFYERLLEARY